MAIILSSTSCRRYRGMSLVQRVWLPRCHAVPYWVTLLLYLHVRSNVQSFNTCTHTAKCRKNTLDNFATKYRLWTRESSLDDLFKPNEVFDIVVCCFCLADSANGRQKREYKCTYRRVCYYRKSCFLFFCKTKRRCYSIITCTFGGGGGGGNGAPRMRSTLPPLPIRKPPLAGFDRQSDMLWSCDASATQ